MYQTCSEKDHLNNYKGQDVQQQLNVQQLVNQASAGDAVSQLALGKYYFQQNQLEDMEHWLRKAAQAGLAEAQDAFGYLFHKGMQVKRDFEQAAFWYRQAAEQGDLQSIYRLAELNFLGINHQVNYQAALEGFAVAAAEGYPPAMRTLGFLVAQWDQERATQWFARGAHSGDACSRFCYGYRLLHGIGIKEDPDAAFYWLYFAAEAQFPHAADYYNLAYERLTLTDNAQIQAHIQQHYPLSAMPPGLGNVPENYAIVNQSSHWKTLNSSPDVAWSKSFFSVEECAWLMNQAHPHMRRSEVISLVKDGNFQESGVRTSQSMFYSDSTVDAVVRLLERRMCAAVSHSMPSSEPVSVLFYGQGQEYRPHFDYFDPTLASSEDLMAQGGQRLKTIIVYLNNVEKGGATSFPHLGVEVNAKIGHAVRFDNCDQDGKPYPSSLHAGTPVMAGEKWLAVKWMRETTTIYDAI